MAELNASLNVVESNASERNAALVLVLAHSNSSIVFTAESHSFHNHSTNFSNAQAASVSHSLLNSVAVSQDVLANHANLLFD